MSGPSLYLLGRYAIAVAAVAVAVLLRLLLAPLLGDLFPFATLFFAVLFAAWQGGFGPAATAALLGGLLSWWLVLPAQGSFAVHGIANHAGLALYLAVSLAIALFGGAMRKARQRAEANAYQRAEAVERHRRVEVQLTYLVQASATLTSNLEPSAVLSSVLELSRNVLPADAYAIWLFHAASGRWQIAAAFGLSEQYQQVKIRMLEKTPAMSEQPLAADDVARLPLLAERLEAYHLEGIRSLLAVPLRMRGQVCGTLTLYHRRPHPFPEEEIRVGTALGNLAAAVIASADLYADQARLRAEAQRAERVSRFLADASAELAGLVDYRSTLQKVARLAVPFFADWCSIDMLEPDGSLQRLAVAHVDPAKVELAHELQRRYPPDPATDAGNGVWTILRTGESRIVPNLTDEMLAQGAKDAAMLQILRDLGLRSYIGVPLSARGKVLGVIAFVAAESGRLYEPGDLAVAEDLAHRAGVAIENAQLYEALRDADRRKDEFLAVLAHELRNPLAPVRNALQILKLAGADANAALQAREMAERQVQHLTRLVDDLLDVSRIMRGKIELRKERVALATLIDRAVETARPAFDEAGHRLTIALPPAPLLLDVDVVRMAQVVANLLTNGAKYTEPGGRLELNAGREGGDVVVRVRDTGIGIAAEVLPRVFELFVQAAPAAAHSQGGLGIGLTLVKSLVELHGGRVEARSEGLGKGSEFVVRLPFTGEAAGAGSGTKPTTVTAEPPKAGRRVLVVDDNVDAAVSLALLLRLEGHEVRVAHDGVEALAQVAVAAPDCVILDLGMPKMDGYEVARRLRKTPGLEGMRLVAVTGWGQEEDRRRTREAGFDQHFVKPVEPATLQELLAALRP